MEISPEDIRICITESAEGNTESFRRLYEHLIDRVFAYLRSRSGTKEQATDLAQEVFVELWQALPRFIYHTHEQFYAFVFIIARRKLIKLYTQRGKETLFIDDENTIVDIEKKDGRETNDALTRALDLLDPEAREIVVLHHWSRYTFKEIGEFINKTETAVRVQHHRAIKLLQTHLTNVYHG